MQVVINLTVDEAQCEALIQEEGQPEKHIVAVTAEILLRKVNKYIFNRLEDEEIPMIYGE